MSDSHWTFSSNDHFRPTTVYQGRCRWRLSVIYRTWPKTIKDRLNITDGSFRSSPYLP